MLLVGSRSLSTHVKLDRDPDDWDIYMHLAEFEAIKAKHPYRQIASHRYHAFVGQEVLEIHTIHPGDTDTDAQLLQIAEANNYSKVKTPVGEAYNACLHMHKLLKLSTYGLLNKHKNYRDLAVLKDVEVLWPEILEQRIEETIKRQETKVFFNRYNIRRYVDHDQLHQWVAQALQLPQPTFDKVIAGSVEVTPELFFEATLAERHSCIVEEAIVLGIERWLLHRVKASNVFKLWDEFQAVNSSSDPALKWLDKLCSPGVVKDHPTWVAEWAGANHADLKETLKKTLLLIKDKMPSEFWSLVNNIKSNKILPIET